MSDTSDVSQLPVGICGRKFPRAAELGPFGLLDRCAELGHAGVFFRTVLDISPTLDAGLLAEVRQRADELGLYLEMGLHKVNPYNTPETPEVRDLGHGDYLNAMIAMTEACVAVGCTSLWADTANYQRHSWDIQANDRFRSDVTWKAQLKATRDFLKMLTPVLRANDAVIALETHEEITTPEILWLIEAVGEDVLGVTLDLANVVVRGEDPVEATRRLAPYTRQSHMRDVVLFSHARGLERQIRACGDGMIDWHAVVGLLREHAPNLNYTIENCAVRDFNLIPLYDKRWQESRGGVDLSETIELVRLATMYEKAARAGRLPGPDDYYREGASLAEQEDFITRSAAALRAVDVELASQGAEDQKNGDV